MKIAGPQKIVIAIVVGALIGLGAYLQEPGFATLPFCLLGGAALGLVAGTILTVLDSRRS